MPRHPNLLLVMCDQWRAASTGFAGDPAVRTPTLDRLAAQGTVLETAYCSSPVCSPARASWLTGLYPHGHGQLDNYGPGVPEGTGFRLPAQTITIGDLLSDAGYRCGISGPWHLGDDELPQHGFEQWDVYRYHADPERTDPYLRHLREHGLEAAFDHDHRQWAIKFARAMADGFDPTAVAAIPTPQQRTTWTVDRAIDFVRAHAGGPGPWLHLCSIKDPHPPLVAPAETLALYDPGAMPLPRTWDDDLTGKPAFLRGSGHHAAPRFGVRIMRRIAAHYYALCTHVDRQLDRLLSELDDTGTARDTIVCFISDHGESLGEHGLYAKSVMYEQSVRVPWIVRWPGRIIAGARLRRPVGGVDLVPTLLELAGIPARTPFHGRSLASALRSGTEPPAVPVLSEIRALEREPDESLERLAGTIMVRHGRWKYVRHRFDPCEELYDLHTDPDEMSNLVGTQRGRGAELRAGIAAVLRAHGAGPYAWAAGDR